jgi:nitrate reductase gamma subunit
MAGMNPDLLGFAHHTGLRLAEVGFLLMLIAGVWLAAAQLPQLQALKWGKFRTVVAGVVLAIGAALLIVATHWGHFG